MNVRNLDEIRSRDPKLFEALQDIRNGIVAMQQQTNTNPQGEPVPPPAISSVSVKGRDGYAHVSITDNSNIYRGIRYFVEHADNPQFTNPIVVPLNDSRNAAIPVGNQTRYFRAYSSYSPTAPSAAVYHGDAANPIAVEGGGTGPGPDYGESQGSGTGTAGQALQGPGTSPFRSATGASPSRSEG